MNIITKSASAVCLFAVAHAVSAAEPSNGGKNTAADAAPLSSNNATDDKGRSTSSRANGEGHYLRCWQYGRLIFEEAIAVIPPEVAAEGRAFRGKGEQKPSVYLLESKSGATCLVK